MKEDTPLMKQYNEIKAKYPDALLLFRVGDFYETFGQDAIRASKALGIVLTKRSNGAAADMELAGFPHHSLETYLPKLVRAGMRVAICDQLEDPKTTKKIVKRGVTELVTPGVTFSDKILEHKSNNFLAAYYSSKSDGQLGLAFIDASTGEFFLAEGRLDYIDKLLQTFQPSPDKVFKIIPVLLNVYAVYVKINIFQGVKQSFFTVIAPVSTYDVLNSRSHKCEI